MHSETRDSCPLLNDYKQKFLLSRIPQTILGGVRVRNVPRKVLTSQLLVFALPFVLSIPTAILNLFLALPIFVLSGAAGTVLALLLILVNFTPRSKNTTFLQENRGFSLEEENEISIKRVLSWEHFEFLFPSSKHLFFKLLDPLLYGLLFALGSEVTRSDFIMGLLGVSSATYILLYIFAWFSLCTGMFSLVCNAPQETAVFRPDDVVGVNHLYRPTYLLVVLGVLLALSAVYCSSSLADITAVLENTELHILSGLYVLLALLAIIFILGVLPPVDCLCSFILEFWLVNLCGCSPSSSDTRSVLQVVLTSGVIYASFYVTQHRIVFIATVSALLSCNVLALDPGVYKTRVFWFFVLISTTSSCLVAIGAVVLEPGQEDYIGWVLLVTWCLLLVFTQMKRVFVLGFVRNPVYSSKTLQLVLRYVKIEDVLVPFLLSYYYSSRYYSSSELVSPWDCVLLCRAYRKIWQCSRRSLEDTLLFLALQQLDDNITIYGHHVMTTHPLLMLFLCSVVLDAKYRICEMLLFCVKLQYDFLALKKQRRNTGLKITLLNAISLPLISLVVLISAVTWAPILPIFSLPLFYLSFPRPARFWPSPTTPNFSSSHDSSYYKQITPQVTSALRQTFSVRGAPRAGSFLLARAEQLLLLVHVLDAGYGYCSVVVKGLELQETSCHTEEVNVVKEIFDQAFSGSGTCTNEHYFHMMQPLAQSTVQTYSDARNVLTGVLDSPICLGKVQVNFMKCLIYLISKRCPNLAGPVEYTQQHASAALSQTAGFDFTKLRQTTVKRGTTTEVLEDTDSAVFTKPSPPDFLDNLSFDDSEDSWFGTVISNKTAVKPKVTDIETNKTETKTEARRESESKIGDAERSDVPVGEDWLTLPFSKCAIDKVAGKFPRELFELCFDKPDSEEQLKVLCLAAHLAINNDQHKSPYQVVRTYNGTYEWNQAADWLKSNQTLGALVKLAYRYSVKLAIDEVVFGECENAKEFLENISEICENWFIGNEKDAEWSDCVQNSKKQLFSLGLNSEGIYSSRTLSLTSLPIDIGVLNSECVKSLWASLALELFYLTNDDEERYSIQAHPNLLRNITIQAADLPLGYPLYLSSLQHVPVL